MNIQSGLVRTAAAFFLFILTAGAAMAMDLQSPDFENGQPLKATFTCDGDDMSPELLWLNPPENTESFALIMDDPDAPAGVWTHWVVYDIPASANTFAAGMPRTQAIENGAKQGINDFGKIGYNGPCPPPGPEHHYSFRLYALDAVLNLPPGKSKRELEEVMQDHIIVYTELIGTYGRDR